MITEAPQGDGSYNSQSQREQCKGIEHYICDVHQGSPAESNHRPPQKYDSTRVTTLVTLSNRAAQAC